jgi:UDP-N-acetylmuramate--alanine ligase
MAEGLVFNGIGIGLGGQGEISAEQIDVKNGAYCFNLNFADEQWSNLSGPLPGRHNLMNVVMAVAMARGFGLTRDQVAKSLLNFKGIHRRFNQYKLADNKILIDDYAHHPTELRALLQGVKEFYPDQPHILLFQPHLFSRTRDFAHDFAQVLSEFDRVLLMPIYPARELPIPGIDSDWLARLCDPQRVQAMTASMALATFAESSSSIFIVAGAGDIGLEVQSLKQKLTL